MSRVHLFYIFKCISRLFNVSQKNQMDELWKFLPSEDTFLGDVSLFGQCPYLAVVLSNILQLVNPITLGYLNNAKYWGGVLKTPPMDTLKKSSKYNENCKPVVTCTYRIKIQNLRTLT